MTASACTASCVDNSLARQGLGMVAVIAKRARMVDERHIIFF